ncbi:uncharacterized protein LOC119307169 isoform X2 [Triticum dicoccoides]|uniref:uncharacterized protein LOC119307169 isoform X2 n=1 Tax=Triticum dicoccoides TaxID=85692 RepID=UPI00188DE194|nr:uncharacterized protein LOC119307169 isoform X2 [Triticum dicoccoides]XP_044386607.1 uncharacterized protein LOC123110200 isoform X1 [Triticum aestivum]
MAATNKVRQGGEALLACPAATTRAAGCRWAQPGGGRPGASSSAPPADMAHSPVALRWEEKFDDEVGYRDYDEEEDEEGEGRFTGGTRSGGAMPMPPAGFVLDDQGWCIAAASKHIVTILRGSENFHSSAFAASERCSMQSLIKWIGISELICELDCYLGQLMVAWVN